METTISPTEHESKRFAVYAEGDAFPKPLLLHGLSFARLIDDVVVPYDSNEAFFIDGAPLTRKELKRIKILRESDGFRELFRELHRLMRWGDIDRQKLYAAQYDTRLEALLRESTEDVTAQIIKAFDARIKPSLKDYLPKREELIRGAFQLFIESMKALNS